MIDPWCHNQVEEVDRAISAAERQLVQQAGLVAELQAQGRDAQPAEARMASLETALNTLRLRRQLAVSWGLALARRKLRPGRSHQWTAEMAVDGGAGRSRRLLRSPEWCGRRRNAERYE